MPKYTSKSSFKGAGRKKVIPVKDRKKDNRYPPEHEYYYHGTTLKKAKEILEKGILGSNIDLKDCKYGIFVTSSEDGAEWWAKQRMFEEQEYETIPAVVSIKIDPKDEMTWDPFPLWKEYSSEIICSKFIPKERIELVYPTTKEEEKEIEKEWVFFDADKFLESGDVMFNQEDKEILERILGKYFNEYVMDRMIEFEDV